jgi:hypothetical protein
MPTVEVDRERQVGSRDRPSRWPAACGRQFLEQDADSGFDARRWNPYVSALEEHLPELVDEPLLALDVPRLVAAARSRRHPDHRTRGLHAAERMTTSTRSSPPLAPI